MEVEALTDTGPEKRRGREGARGYTSFGMSGRLRNRGAWVTTLDR